MLRSFIYQENENYWFEENKNLLSYDVAAFLDEEEKILYIWSGPDSSKKRLEKGYESVVELLSNYPNDSIQLMLLMDDIPDKINLKLESMLKNAKKDLKTNEVQFTKLTTIRLYLVMSIITIILPIFSTINLLNFITVPISDAISIVPIAGYNTWLSFSFIYLPDF